jgi:hypothetical protein
MPTTFLTYIVRKNMIVKGEWTYLKYFPGCYFTCDINDSLALTVVRKPDTIMVIVHLEHKDTRIILKEPQQDVQREVTTQRGQEEG